MLCSTCANNFNNTHLKLVLNYVSLFIAWYKIFTIDLKAFILNISIDVCLRFVCSSYLYCMLKFIAYDDGKRRSQGQIQEPRRISDEVLCNFLPLPIVAKSSILSVVGFLDPSLKTSPDTKTSPVSCENLSFFLVFRTVTTILFFCYFLQYDKVLLSSLSVGCYHYFVLMDPGNGYSMDPVNGHNYLYKSKFH